MAKIKCDTNIVPENLDWCEGQDVIPGIRSELFYIRKKDIVKWAVMPQDGNMSDLAKYIGNFELAADAFWNTIYIDVDGSPVTSEAQGEKPSVTYLNTLTGKLYNVDKASAGFAKMARNADLVYLYQEKPGAFRVIGSKMWPTKTVVSMNSGSKATDSDAGSTITVTVTDLSHPPYYDGSVTTEDGDANSKEEGEEKED